jgi:hypothetical protein
MSSVKMVLVKDEGVLGYIIKEYSLAGATGARVKYYYDGLSYDTFLHKDEYIEKFTGEIND